MNPPPIAFANAQRAAQRSPLALYQVISQGRVGTAITKFAHLSEADRCALAFYVGGMAYSPEMRGKGEALWRDDPTFRRRLPTLETLSRASEADLAKDISAADAQAITAYLRAKPEVRNEEHEATGSFAVARQRLTDSVNAYRHGDVPQAKALALLAYLDGVEPVEPTLVSRDRALMRDIENAMAQLRSRIDQQAPVDDVAAQAKTVAHLFDRAESVLLGSEAMLPLRSSAALLSRCARAWKRY